MQTNYGTMLKAIEEIANIGYFEVDLQTGRWFFSENLCRILGLTPKESYSLEEFKNLIHPDDHENAVTYFNQSLKNGSRFDYEYRCILPNGNTINMKIKSRIITDANNKPVKVIGINQDISSVNLGKTKLNELKELNKKKNDILGTVAHDLKSPLFSIFGMSELLKEKANSDQLDLINYIQEALGTANDIVTGLIEMAQIEEDDELLHCKLSDINKILVSSINHFKIRAEKKQIKIKSDLCDNAIADVDPVKFSRIIDNLLLNAIKFTNEGGDIIISSHRAACGLNITVEDTGIGIDSEVMPELFSKFSKARRKGTSGEKSTGLGLSIVKELVELHKGKITVESRVNRGTKFTVFIPVNEGETLQSNFSSDNH